MSSYTKLAEDLSTLALEIRKVEDSLEGESTASTASKLSKAAEAFRKIVARVLAESDPEIKNLAQTLRSARAAKNLDAGVVAKIGKAILGNSFKPKKSESDDAARERLLLVASELGQALEVRTTVERFLDSSAISLPSESSEEELRDELRRLGALTRAEQDLTIETRLKGPILVALLKMTGFKPSAKTGTVPKKKMDDFLRYCTTLCENTGYRVR